MSHRRPSNQLPMIIMILVMVFVLAIVYLVSAFVDTEQTFVLCPDSSHYLGGKHFKGTPTCGPEQQSVQDNDPELTKPTSHFTARQLKKMTASQQVSCREFREFISPNLTQKRFRQLHKLHPWGVERPMACKLPAGVPEPFAKKPDYTQEDPHHLSPTTLPPVN